MDQVRAKRYVLVMLIQMNVAEAKAKLSALIARAEAGDRVELCRKGKMVAVIMSGADAPPPKPSKIKWGAWAHLGPFSEDLDALLLAPDPYFAEGRDEEGDI